MSSTQNRQLAAIMFADIAGYTRMMQDDEAKAIQVRHRHKEVLDQAHDEYHGQIIQYYGDGTLSIFRSAVEATHCAIDIQQKFGKGIEVPLRVGIHVGDIVTDGDLIYGDGVNLASRIESVAVPGSVMISDKVKDAIKNQKEIDSISLGQFDFKNVDESIEVFAIANQGLVVPERKLLSGKFKERKKSIAVLPFVNMSSDPENEYFSDGISEEILNALVKVDGLKVTSRTSSFLFKGKQIDVREIGKQLGVGHVLEGSVRKAGNRIRVTAQLISCSDGYQFFSESYDRTLEDIFEVQDDIAGLITNRLREHLTEEQVDQPMVPVMTNNMEAYDLYLQGLFLSNQVGNNEAMAKAIPLFEKAIELQEDFALPHAQLGLCYYFMAFGGQITWDRARAKGQFHIEHSKALGFETPVTYFALFVYHFFSAWDWSSAMKVVTEGIQKFPNDARLYHALSTMYLMRGETEKYLSTHIKGLQRDPLSPQLILYMGIGYFWVGDFENAKIYLHKTLNMIPNHRPAIEYFGWIEVFQGHYEAAIPIFESLEPIGYRLHRSTCLGWAYWKMGLTEKAEACLHELIELEKQHVGIAHDLAHLYICMGDLDNAFFWLKKTLENRIGSSMMVWINPFFETLYNDPRFKEIEEIVGDVPPITLNSS